MAKVIMIQGTMSGVGKSLLVAGLCRILKQDGIKVAPFKSQNMALNSYITREGLEMGRAQVVQAEAAGIEPSVLMNPILLKPTDHVGSQVIVNGEVLGHMSAREYFANKRELIPHILTAYSKLEREYDVIVVEGAGSPAEINLRECDIVNMGLAKLINAPVLLAGDIDRGGVFAQLYGTAELLELEERALIKGLIINKFRGDEAILKPGIAMLEKKVRRRVIGTIPMMHVDIEEEDSLSERLLGRQEVQSIDIAVIRFPRLSNYTDLAPLEHLPGVSVRYVGRESELKQPDLILLPGSKNTMADLEWMRTSGIEAGILKRYQDHTLVFGICGGFQMLGERLSDPEGVECQGTMRGMGLLPLETTFTPAKTRTRVEGTVNGLTGAYAALSDAEYNGYEIHMGETTAIGPVQAFAKAGERILGYCGDRAAGTYIHGLFDTASMCRQLLELLAGERGLDIQSLGSMDFAEYKEQQYEILAEEMRKHLQMETIYEILDKGADYDGRI